MDDGSWPYSMMLFFVFIVLEAVFYGFGSAVQNMNAGNLEREAGEGNKRAEKLLRIAGRPSRVIHSIRIVSNAIGMFIGAYILGRWSRQLEKTALFPDGEIGDWLHMAALFAVGVLALVLLISFGIVIPKRCAAKYPEKWGYTLLPVVSAVMVPLMPFIWAVIGLSAVVLRLLGIDISANEENVTQEEIMSMVNEGHEQGVLEASEAEMITNIFEFDDKDAGDIMTHRTNLVMIDGAMPLKEAISFILSEGKNSRYPVYGEDMDDIIGILHMKDAMIYAEKEGRSKMPVSQIPGLLRKAHFIPESRNIDPLFKEMQSQKTHMEVVVDEYGQIAGIVTMEDILEEIVGNILDEYDAEEEYIVPSGDGFILDGLTPLDEIGDVLDMEFAQEDDDNFDTLNGFLISKMDRLPQEDEDFEIEYEGYRFKVLRVENKTIRRVRAVRTRETEKDGEKPQQGDA